MPLRPTPDALRERAFAVLAGAVDGVAFLDLFAGTGTVGLEALSRGARQVVFVEHHRAAVRLIESNLQALEVEQAAARVMAVPVGRALAELAGSDWRFGVIWADPPFDGWEQGLEALERAAELGLLAPGGTACLECPAKPTVVPGGGLDVVRDLAGGASRLVLLRQSRATGDG
jgi:16S rRNA (guanine966-N2)-methyltransferase